MESQITRLLARLDALYPAAQCELVHRDAFELLVATVLSAQSTDVRVNLVTPALFDRYPDAAALSLATADDVVPFIRSLGLFNNKAKALVGIAVQLVEKHDGQVPAELAALVALPGVARKTANVVLQNIWAVNEGFVVDTHVRRLAVRLGLSEATNVRGIERDLMAKVPRAVWGRLSHQLILHGRRRCRARRPDCAGCALRADCPTGRDAP